MVPTDTEAAVVFSRVVCGDDAQTLACIGQADVELALWRRSTNRTAAARHAGLRRWLADLPEAMLPTVHAELQPSDTVAALQIACHASGMPPGPMQQALLADIADLVERFATITQCTSVKLRLEPIATDACRRWHRDCMPLRLITTYRGPGTEWVRPEHSAATIARPDDNVACSEQLASFDVALFKGCGWPGSSHDTGILHRSPRVASQGVTRLLLVLNPPFDFKWGQNK